MIGRELREFEDRHGGRDKAVVIGQYVYYPDGAIRENVGVLAGMDLEPPTDRIQRARRILRYREELLRRAVRDFDRMKRELLSQVITSPSRVSVPPPPDQAEAVATLKHFQAIVLQRQKEVDEISEIVYGKTPEQLEMDAAAGRNHAANREFAKAIQAIEV